MKPHVLNLQEERNPKSGEYLLVEMSHRDQQLVVSQRNLVGRNFLDSVRLGASCVQTLQHEILFLYTEDFVRDDLE